ncbi:UDP-N-acetylmuramoyl-L-alanine--D-glutamate ligase [Bulleidia sp. zg-1006]|uniref:UDP-N-acetylmuramoyl-L-alanine--D-glutamate ligase n=1 Tax=Bulleidia sp. zg-1006 TaxID=2806552 RepID=UPI001939BF68|nr:UDP-N-acetylmuramoyl-L-alanine--D-glutamate ligase [Bulleidia sp. zg-1006]QRG86163.1 UDP-N-acetylmuramoyl-L-alanine--D-glutamate ligase [Bulleidia sp. zg-1006]
MLEQWKTLCKDKKIAIWGLGQEGESSYYFLHHLLPEMELTLIDQKGSPAFQKNYEKATLKTIEEVNLQDFDCILKAPGIVLKPDQELETISSQTELFLRMYREQVIGITGTKGKSTTSSLVYALLKQEKKVVLVGNIGKPCFEEIEAMEQGALAVFELSCHQMEYTRVSPHIAVFLNLYEEHLDHYGSFAKYGLAKSHIYAYQQDNDLAIVHPDLPDFLPKLQKAWYLQKDVYAKDGYFINPVAKMTMPKTKLIGHHNEQNMAIAVAIAMELGMHRKAIEQGLKEFEPLEHRLEYIGEYKGIHYVNDSISTIGQSCIQAIESLPLVQTILIGGMDRGIDYQVLENYIQTHPMYYYIFMYATGKRILSELGKKEKNFYAVETLKEAVSLAKKITNQGRMILLSPAASSYDAFKNFEDRGHQFKEMVKNDVE